MLKKIISTLLVFTLLIPTNITLREVKADTYIPNKDTAKKLSEYEYIDGRYIDGNGTETSTPEFNDPSIPSKVYTKYKSAKGVHTYYDSEKVPREYNTNIDGKELSGRLTTTYINGRDGSTGFYSSPVTSDDIIKVAHVDFGGSAGFHTMLINKNDPLLNKKLKLTVPIYVPYTKDGVVYDEPSDEVLFSIDIPITSSMIDIEESGSKDELGSTLKDRHINRLKQLNENKIGLTQTWDRPLLHKGINTTSYTDNDNYIIRLKNNTYGSLKSDFDTYLTQQATARGLGTEQINKLKQLYKSTTPVVNYVFTGGILSAGTVENFIRSKDTAYFENGTTLHTYGNKYILWDLNYSTKDTRSYVVKKVFVGNPQDVGQVANIRYTGETGVIDGTLTPNEEKSLNYHLNQITRDNWGRVDTLDFRDFNIRDKQDLTPMPADEKFYSNTYDRDTTLPYNDVRTFKDPRFYYEQTSKNRHFSVHRQRYASIYSVEQRNVNFNVKYIASDGNNYTSSDKPNIRGTIRVNYNDYAFELNGNTSLTKTVTKFNPVTKEEYKYNVTLEGLPSGWVREYLQIDGDTVNIGVKKEETEEIVIKKGTIKDIYGNIITDDTVKISYKLHDNIIKGVLFSTLTDTTYNVIRRYSATLSNLSVSDSNYNILGVKDEAKKEYTINLIEKPVTLKVKYEVDRIVGNLQNEITIRKTKDQSEVKLPLNRETTISISREENSTDKRSILTNIPDIDLYTKQIIYEGDILKLKYTLQNPQNYKNLKVEFYDKTLTTKQTAENIKLRYIYDSNPVELDYNPRNTYVIDTTKINDTSIVTGTNSIYEFASVDNTGVDYIIKVKHKNNIGNLLVKAVILDEEKAKMYEDGTFSDDSYFKLNIDLVNNSYVTMDLRRFDNINSIPKEVLTTTPDNFYAHGYNGMVCLYNINALSSACNFLMEIGSVTGYSEGINLGIDSLFENGKAEKLLTSKDITKTYTFKISRYQNNTASFLLMPVPKTALNTPANIDAYVLYPVVETNNMLDANTKEVKIVYVAKKVRLTVGVRNGHSLDIKLNEPLTKFNKLNRIDYTGAKHNLPLNSDSYYIHHPNYKDRNNFYHALDRNFSLVTLLTFLEVLPDKMLEGANMSNNNKTSFGLMKTPNKPLNIADSVAYSPYKKFIHELTKEYSDKLKEYIKYTNKLENAPYLVAVDRDNNNNNPVLIDLANLDLEYTYQKGTDNRGSYIKPFQYTVDIKQKDYRIPTVSLNLDGVPYSLRNRFYLNANNIIIKDSKGKEITQLKSIDRNKRMGNLIEERLGGTTYVDTLLDLYNTDFDALDELFKKGADSQGRKDIELGKDLNIEYTPLNGFTVNGINLYTGVQNYMNNTVELNLGISHTQLPPKPTYPKDLVVDVEYYYDNKLVETVKDVPDSELIVERVKSDVIDGGDTGAYLYTDTFTEPNSAIKLTNLRKLNNKDIPLDEPLDSAFLFNNNKKDTDMFFIQRVANGSDFINIIKLKSRKIGFDAVYTYWYNKLIAEPITLDDIKNHHELVYDKVNNKVRLKLKYYKYKQLTRIGVVPEYKGYDDSIMTKDLPYSFTIQKFNADGTLNTLEQVTDQRGNSNKAFDSLDNTYVNSAKFKIANIVPPEGFELVNPEIYDSYNTGFTPIFKRKRENFKSKIKVEVYDDRGIKRENSSYNSILVDLYKVTPSGEELQQENLRIDGSVELDLLSRNPDDSFIKYIIKPKNVSTVFEYKPGIEVSREETVVQLTQKQPYTGNITIQLDQPLTQSELQSLGGIPVKAYNGVVDEKALVGNTYIPVSTGTGITITGVLNGLPQLIDDQVPDYTLVADLKGYTQTGITKSGTDFNINLSRVVSPLNATIQVPTRPTELGSTPIQIKITGSNGTVQTFTLTDTSIFNIPDLIDTTGTEQVQYTLEITNASEISTVLQNTPSTSYPTVSGSRGNWVITFGEPTGTKHIITAILGLTSDKRLAQVDLKLKDDTGETPYKTVYLKTRLPQTLYIEDGKELVVEPKPLDGYKQPVLLRDGTNIKVIYSSTKALTDPLNAVWQDYNGGVYTGKYREDTVYIQSQIKSGSTVDFESVLPLTIENNYQLDITHLPVNPNREFILHPNSNGVLEKFDIAITDKTVTFKRKKDLLTGLVQLLRWDNTKEEVRVKIHEPNTDPDTVSEPELVFSPIETGTVSYTIPKYTTGDDEIQYKYHINSTKYGTHTGDIKVKDIIDPLLTADETTVINLTLPSEQTKTVEFKDVVDNTSTETNLPNVEFTITGGSTTGVTKIANSTNNHTITLSDLPKYNKDGVLITYTITPTIPSGWEQESSTDTLLVLRRVKTYLTGKTISVEFKQRDGINPLTQNLPTENINVRLVPTDTTLPTKQFTLTSVLPTKTLQLTDGVLSKNSLYENETYTLEFDEVTGYTGVVSKDTSDNYILTLTRNADTEKHTFIVVYQDIYGQPVTTDLPVIDIGLKIGTTKAHSLDGAGVINPYSYTLGTNEPISYVPYAESPTGYTVLSLNTAGTLEKTHSIVLQKIPEELKDRVQIQFKGYDGNINTNLPKAGLDSISLVLKADNGLPDKPITITRADNWQKSLAGLGVVKKNASGTDITYTAEVTLPAGYTIDTNEYNSGVFNIILKRDFEPVDGSIGIIFKKYNSDTTLANPRLDSITGTVTVTDGIKTITKQNLNFTPDNNWELPIDIALPKYDTSDNEIDYTIFITEPEGYTLVTVPSLVGTKKVFTLKKEDTKVSDKVKVVFKDYNGVTKTGTEFYLPDVKFSYRDDTNNVGDTNIVLPKTGELPLSTYSTRDPDNNDYNYTLTPEPKDGYSVPVVTHENGIYTITYTRQKELLGGTNFKAHFKKYNALATEAIDTNKIDNATPDEFLVTLNNNQQLVFNETNGYEIDTSSFPLKDTEENLIDYGIKTIGSPLGFEHLHTDNRNIIYRRVKEYYESNMKAEFKKTNLENYTGNTKDTVLMEVYKTDKDLGAYGRSSIATLGGTLVDTVSLTKTANYKAERNDLVTVTPDGDRINYYVVGEDISEFQKIYSFTLQGKKNSYLVTYKKKTVPLDTKFNVSWVDSSGNPLTDIPTNRIHIEIKQNGVVQPHKEISGVGGWTDCTLPMLPKLDPDDQEYNYEFSAIPIDGYIASTEKQADGSYTITYKKKPNPVYYYEEPKTTVPAMKLVPATKEIPLTKLEPAITEPDTGTNTKPDTNTGSTTIPETSIIEYIKEIILDIIEEDTAKSDTSSITDILHLSNSSILDIINSLDLNKRKELLKKLISEVNKTKDKTTKAKIKAIITLFPRQDILDIFGDDIPKNLPNKKPTKDPDNNIKPHTTGEYTKHSTKKDILAKTGGASIRYWIIGVFVLALGLLLLLTKKKKK